MADTRYSLYAGELRPDGTPSNNIDLTQADSDNFAPNPTKAFHRPGGLIDRSTIGLSHADPLFTIQTCDLATVLANISPTTGLALDNGATFIRQKRAAESTFVAAATAEHMVYDCTKAFACLESFEVNQDDENGARVVLNTYPLSSDGMTPPVTKAAGAINSYPTPAYVSRFFMGHIDINSSEVGGITGYSIQYAKNYSLKRYGGDVFATFGAITMRDPSIRIRTNASDLDAAINVFLNQVAGNIELYAYREDVAQSNGRAPLANSVHVKHTADGEWSMDEDSVSQDDDANIGFTVNVTGTMSVTTTSTGT